MKGILQKKPHTRMLYFKKWHVKKAKMCCHWPYVVTQG
jgi:hypothetical protein